MKSLEVSSRMSPKRVGMTRRALAILLLLLVLPGTSVQANADHQRIVTLVIKHSHFSANHFDVHVGDRVRFVVVNLDPIDHELIVGGTDVQTRHENGSELLHGAVPGEVTAFAEHKASTRYSFKQPGTVFFACHYPGHFAYGMKGTISVR